MMEMTSDDILDTSQLSFAGDFDAQVVEILTRVRLTRREVENLQCLLDDLEHALSYIIPGCQVYPFGSIVTGLGIKTSDIDCFVQLPPGYEHHTHKNMINKASKHLRRDPRRFAQLFAIANAKVPIVKFLHLPTGFNCDVNFSSLSGVRNSRLIAFLLNLDRRALPLAIIIKYWSKVYHFTGTNLMPNYALTMMVIFYLQIKSILPSVAELQRHKKEQMVEAWNTGFNDDFEYISDNSDSLYGLLGGFFDYYKCFDFEHYVIAPFLGHPIEKKLIADLNTLSDEYSLYKENVLNKLCKTIRLDTSLCVQDPFQHCRNCSVGVFGRLFTKIKAHFDLAANAFKVMPKDEFLREVLTMTQLVAVPKAVNTKPHFVTNNKVTKKNHRLKNTQHKATYHYAKWVESRRYNHKGVV